MSSSGAPSARSPISARRWLKGLRSILCSRVDAITSSRAIIERYRKPQFDPNAFSAMKVYRASGERGLRERLNEIDESRHLQELAKAQQISLPRELRGKAADASALRDAIVKGVKTRHEDWQAAS